MTDEGSNDEMLEDLRKSLQLAVCKIVFAEDRKQGTRSSQSAIAALTELTYQYATKSLVPDLYAFSTHANRKSTISPDDVALVLRKIQPDQLKIFKDKFCKGSTSSKNDNDKRASTTTVGRRRKRNEADVLSLSSSSSSSDDDDEGGNGTMNGKQKRNRGASPKISGRKSTERESLLNKFQLRGASGGKKNTLNYDTLSSDDDDDDILMNPSRGLGIAKTTAVEEKNAQKSRSSPKLSLKGLAFRKKKPTTDRSKRNAFLDDDDDFTSDDDSFLESAKRTKEKAVNLQQASSRENGNRGNFDDCGSTWDKRFGNKGSGSQRQSQVAEALANLSSDSGMDEDSEDDK